MLALADVKREHMTTSERKTLSENPKYQVGDIIEITSEYKALPGSKDLKPGKYVVKLFRDPYASKVQYHKIYEIVSTRKNSKYVYCFSQEWVEQNSKKSC